MTENERDFLVEDLIALKEKRDEFPAGSKERQAIASEIVDICRIINENDKNANEFFIRSEQNELQDEKNKKDSELLAIKNEEEKKDKKWQRGLQIAGITICLGDLIQRGIAWKQTMHLEENGTLKTQTGRGLFGLFNRGNRPKM